MSDNAEWAASECCDSIVPHRQSTMVSTAARRQASWLAELTALPPHNSLQWKSLDQTDSEILVFSLSLILFQVSTFCIYISNKGIGLYDR